MVCVGVDISKDKSMICIIRDGIIEKAPYEISHVQEDLSQLVALIHTYTDDSVRVVMEATGHYYWPVVSFLLEHKIFVACINPMQIKRFCSQNIRRVKTDKADAINIARFGIAYWDNLICAKFDADTYFQLRLYARQYYTYTSLLVKAKMNLDMLLDNVMPGIKKILVDQHGRSKLSDFVMQYRHFANISTMSEDEFIIDYSTWVKQAGYKNSAKKAKDIHALARQATPALPSNDAMDCIVMEAVRAIKEIMHSQMAMMEQMHLLAETLPEYPIVVSMGGVGSVLAARVIAEIGDISRFHNRGALIAYAGIDAPPYQSGAFTSMQRRISKRGNKYLRKTGFEIMQSVMRQKPQHDSAVYEFMLKKEEEGKLGKRAKIAGLNKFLRIYYARVSEVYSSNDVFKEMAIIPSWSVE